MCFVFSKTNIPAQTLLNAAHADLTKIPKIATRHTFLCWQNKFYEYFRKAIYLPFEPIFP